MARISPIIPSRLLLASGIFVLLVAAYLMFMPRVLYRMSKPLQSYPSLPGWQSQDRLTVLAPHLDDETLGAGGLIADARKHGIPVSIIFMTNGDDFPLGANLEFKTGYPSPDQLLAFGAKRQEEAIRAAEKLGVPKTSLYFLGLPDRGLAQLVTPEYANKPLTSSGTLKSSAGYPLSYIPNLPYTGNSVRGALVQALNATAPTKVFTTSVQDRHTDHAATGRFLQEISPSLTTEPSIYYFLIHFPNYPWPKGVDQSADLLPPPKLSRSISSWQVLELDATTEETKEQAISEYRTQLRVPSVKTLLNSMIKKNELFYDK